MGNMKTLPMELIIIILLKLPVYSLCKFKFVSKQWLYSITKDSFFVSTHREFCLQNPNILLIEKIHSSQKSHQSRFDLFSFSVNNGSSIKDIANFSLYLDEYESVVMLPSKWDITCFACKNRFYACNPSKQMMWEMPEATYGYCDQVTVGMGYVKERDEYVFARLFNRKYGGYDPGCEVLRLSDGKDCEWELLDLDCPFDISDLGQARVFVENVFYWSKCFRETIYFFDLAKEEFGKCSSPDSRGQGVFNNVGRYWKLVEMDGSLCVVDYLSEHTMDIWVMKGYGRGNRGWVLDYIIDMSAYGPDKYFWTRVVPLDYRNGVIWMGVDTLGLDYYDVEKKCIKRMDRLITSKSKIDRLIAGKCAWLQLYTESFFSFGSR